MEHYRERNLLRSLFLSYLMNIDKYKEIRSSLPQNVQLIAVSKTKPESDIQALYALGQRHFGENKAQELKKKHEDLPKDICWHFIGHLQTNKIKYIIPYVHLIHSIDSYKLLEEVNRQAEKHQRKVACLLQFHIATEETKFGFSWGECEEMLQQYDLHSLKNVEVVGVMGMASLTDNVAQIHQEFATLHDYFIRLKTRYFQTQDSFKELSMGMTDDYPIAVEEGSTMVRVGSAIFGARNYHLPVND